MLLSKGKIPPSSFKLFILFMLSAAVIACGSSGDGSNNATPAANLAGTWTAEEIVSGNCESDTYPIVLTEMYVLSQNGNQLTISIPGENASFNGTITGNKISWNGTKKRTPGEDQIRFSGTVSENGNRITGTARWTYQEPGYTCSGTTAVDASKATNPVEDVSGLWEGTWKSFDNQIDGTFTADIVQSGSQLSGKISVPYIGMVDTDLKGTATGSTIVFGDINDEIVFTGTTVSVTTASGTFDYPALNVDGSWQADKVGGAPSDNRAWQRTDMGFAFGSQGKIIIGDGRNDRISRVYTGDGQMAAGGGNIYEFSYSNGQWASFNFGRYSTEYGGDDLSTIYGMTIGVGRNDGINRLYASGYGSAEFEYSSDHFSGARMDADVQWTNDLVIGDVRQDGQNRVYLAGWSGIYELAFSAAGWNQAFIDTGGVDISSLLITDGRNDGLLRLYAGTRMDNHIYEFTWSDGHWQIEDCGAMASHISISAIVAGNGRNDGRNRIYIAGNGGLAELSYDGNGWQSMPIGSLNLADALAIGPGRNGNRFYLYAATDQDTLVEYAFTGEWQQHSILVQDQKINAIAIGDGRNNGSVSVYAAADDNHVYEFTAP